MLSPTRFGARLYYGLLNPRFGRELQSVMRGRLRYQSQNRAAQRTLLRRNIHRLEKGLIMRPRHPIFAQDYLGETIEAYQALTRQPEGLEEDLIWATAVLQNFFDAVTEPSLTTPGRQALATALANHPWLTRRAEDSYQPSGLSQPRQPFSQERRTALQVSYEQLVSLCLRRRSVRWFTSDTVREELIQKAIAAASLAPSACNRQPFSYHWFSDPQRAAQIAGIAMGTSGYAHQIPSLLVLVGDLAEFPHERDRHLPYIDGALSAMQLMLALETLGLASCPINWPDIEMLERRMTHEMGLPPHQRPIMLIAVGYADPTGGVAFSSKKPVVDLLKIR